MIWALVDMGMKLMNPYYYYEMLWGPFNNAIQNVPGNLDRRLRNHKDLVQRSCGYIEQSLAKIKSETNTGHNWTLVSNVRDTLLTITDEHFIDVLKSFVDDPEIFHLLILDREIHVEDLLHKSELLKCLEFLCLCFGHTLTGEEKNILGSLITDHSSENVTSRRIPNNSKILMILKENENSFKNYINLMRRIGRHGSKLDIGFSKLHNTPDSPNRLKIEYSFNKEFDLYFNFFKKFLNFVDEIDLVCDPSISSCIPKGLLDLPNLSSVNFIGRDTYSKTLYTLDDIDTIKYCTRLSFNNMNLEEIPDNLKEMKSLSGLKFSGIDFDSLKNIEVLAGISKLTDIVIEKAKILEFPKILGKLSGLESLSLRWNQIKTVDRDDFKMIKNIKKLDLSNNHFTSQLPFGELLSLEELYFSGNTVGLESISQLTNLKRLTLVNCQLKEIPNWFHSLENLIELDLRYNEIAVVCGKSLPNLRALSLSCQNTPVELGLTFYNMRSLQVLDLYGTVLKNIPEVCKFEFLKTAVLSKEYLNQEYFARSDFLSKFVISDSDNFGRSCTFIKKIE